MAPAPRYRVSKGEVVTDPKDNIAEAEEDLIDIGDEQPPAHEAVRKLAATQGQNEKKKSVDLSSSPRMSHLPRRTSSIAGMSERDHNLSRSETPDIREHLKHLGPSNLASRPRQTRYNTVKIKPGGGSLVDSAKRQNGAEDMVTVLPPAPQGGVGEGLVSSAGKDAKDGVQAVQSGYGSMDAPVKGPKSPVLSNKAIQINSEAIDKSQRDSKRPQTSREESAQSHSTVGSLPRDDRARSKMPEKTKGARSGSITENVIYSNGIKKVVLETTSSSEDNNDKPAEEQEDGVADDQKENGKPGAESEGKSGKKKRRRKRKKGGSEETPLLERSED